MINLVFNDSIFELEDDISGNRTTYPRRSSHIVYNPRQEQTTIHFYGRTESLSLKPTDIQSIGAVVNGVLQAFTLPTSGIELYAYFLALVGGEAATVQAATGTVSGLPEAIATIEALGGGLAGIPVDRFIGSPVSLVGDPTTVNMNVDGSTTPVIFEFVADTPSNIQLFSLYLEDGQNFADDGFGALAELANGVQVLINGEVAALWKTNRDIILQARQVQQHPFLANESRHLLARTLLEPELFLPEAAKIEVVISDNLSGLTEFQLYVRGYRLKNPPTP